MTKRNYLLVIIVLIAATLVAAVARNMPGGANNHAAATVTDPPPTDDKSTNVTIAFVGDVLMHTYLVRSGYDSASGRYDFTRMFAPVVPYLRRADYAVANLETRLAGQEHGYSGYPRFNSPDELASGLKASGFAMLTTANNHCMDMGWDGIAHTLDTLDAAGLAHTGTARNAAEQGTPSIVTIKGVKIALLNYTAGTNGLPVPKNKPFAVNLLEVKRVTAEAAAAREAGAELVITILHFGEEYQREPNKNQREIVRQLLEGGVDTIIGGHSHVVQPVEMATVQRTGVSFTGLVAYSLGNFASNQRERYRDTGIILYLNISKNARGTSVTGAQYLPVWVQQSAQPSVPACRILPTCPGVDTGTDLPLTDADKARMQQVWEDTHAQLERPEWGVVGFQH